MNKSRSFFSQFLAVTFENLLLFNVGICTTFSFITTSALTKHFNIPNRNEPLFVTNEEASWLGSIGFISQPFGSIASIVISDYLGRKRATMIGNISLAIAWFFMYCATTMWDVFIGNILLGLGAGLIQTAAITYVAEVREPKFRGVMVVYTQLGLSLGMVFLATIHRFIRWRLIAMICSFICIFTTITLGFIPETPLWLLSMNRVDDAEKSLRWLRGWVPKYDIAQELLLLQVQNKRLKSCDVCFENDKRCTHPRPTFRKHLECLKHQRMIKPFVIVVSLLLIATFSGSFAISTYIIQILKAYDSPIRPDIVATILSYIKLIANIFYFFMIRVVSNRSLYVSMLAVLLTSSIVICGYGYSILPSQYTSFVDDWHMHSLEIKELAYIPLVCMFLAVFASNAGINSMPLQMMLETFPNKFRRFWTTLTTALSYILVFISTKSYYTMETTLYLNGFVLFNSIVIAIGMIWIFNILPETLNRTPEEIELHFSDNSKSIIDCEIAKINLKPSDSESTQGIDTHKNVSK